MAFVTTTKGLMDETLLRKIEGKLDNDNEHTTWVEYYDGNELVHRSARITLKKGVEIKAEAANIGI